MDWSLTVITTLESSVRTGGSCSLVSAWQPTENRRIRIGIIRVRLNIYSTLGKLTGHYTIDAAVEEKNEQTTQLSGQE
jgi:hypothetical protein